MASSRSEHEMGKKLSSFFGKPAEITIDPSSIFDGTTIPWSGKRALQNISHVDYAVNPILFSLEAI